MYNVNIIFNNGLQTSIEGVRDYGYRDDVFYVRKDDCNSFIPQDKILYIGVEKIQLENSVSNEYVRDIAKLRLAVEGHYRSIQEMDRDIGKIKRHIGLSIFTVDEKEK